MLDRGIQSWSREWFWSWFGVVPVFALVFTLANPAPVLVTARDLHTTINHTSNVQDILMILQQDTCG